MVGLLLMCALGQIAPKEDCELQLLKYRMALTSGKMTISGKVLRPALGKEDEWIKKIWYDPNHYRCDHFSDKGGKSVRLIYCEECELPGCYVYLDGEALFNPKLKRVPLIIQTLNLPKRVGRYGQELKLDPRVIGIGAFRFDTYRVLKLSRFLGRTDLARHSWERTMWQGKEAWIATSVQKDGFKIRATFVPALANIMVRCEFDGQGPKRGGVATVVHQVMKAEPRQFGTKHIWFPGKVVSQQFEDGKLQGAYELEISDAAFNEPLPADTFRLASMNVPAGTPVNLMTPQSGGRPYMWDGKKVVPAKQDFKVAYPDLPPEEERGGVRRWLLPASIVLALLGLVGVGSYYYRKRQVTIESPLMLNVRNPKLWTLVLGLLIAAGGLLFLNWQQRASADAKAPARTQWEYCTLTLYSAGYSSYCDAKGTIAAKDWKELTRKLNVALRPGEKDSGHIRILILNFLGAQGWELVSHSTRSIGAEVPIHEETFFTFKRRVGK
jgi:hypothetical protein